MAPEILNLINKYFARQAAHLLKDFGEFYPFAAGIDKKGEIIPLSITFGEEHPNPETVIEELERAFKSLLTEGRFSTFAICTDVLVTVPHVSTKTGALEIRYQNSRMESYNIYIPYSLDQESLPVFLEAYSEPGSLHIF